MEKFVQETGVDCLAVAIGNAHGLYQGEPQLDLDLLEKITRRVSLPLVLHGGTGLPADQVRAAIQTGITKINIATDLYHTAAQQMRLAAQTEQPGYFDITRTATQTIRQRCSEYIELFGAAGKGK